MSLLPPIAFILHLSCTSPSALNLLLTPPRMYRPKHILQPRVFSPSSRRQNHLEYRARKPCGPRSFISFQIDRQEIPQHKPEELALVREALLAWADREREWWRPYLAAVAIQRRIR